MEPDLFDLILITLSGVLAILCLITKLILKIWG